MQHFGWPITHLAGQLQAVAAAQPAAARSRAACASQPRQEGVAPCLSRLWAPLSALPRQQPPRDSPWLQRAALASAARQAQALQPQRRLCRVTEPASCGQPASRRLMPQVQKRSRRAQRQPRSAASEALHSATHFCTSERGCVNHRASAPPCKTHSVRRSRRAALTCSAARACLSDETQHSSPGSETQARAWRARSPRLSTAAASAYHPGRGGGTPAGGACEGGAGRPALEPPRRRARSSVR